MRKLFTICAAVLLTAGVFAQSPEKMSYQAVIRNSSDDLVTNTQIGMQISILQGSASGTAVYVETQTPSTNANGLVSLEIGAGTILSGDFTTIDWANGPYFIKTETDPAGGTSYTITGTSQLLSVPFALHAKTAETVTGGITESDPTVPAHVKAITTDNVSDWNEAHGWGDHSAEGYITDYTVTEGDITAHQAAISISGSQITDLSDHESDPTVPAHVKAITTDNVSDWNEAHGWGDHSAEGYITDYTVTEGDVTAHEAAISISGSQITDLSNHETDPTFTANFDFTDAATGDLLQFNGTKWVKVTPDYISDYSVTEEDVTAHQAALEITESQITDLQDYATKNMNNENITNLADPVNAQDAATKAYVDQLISLFEGNGMVVVDFTADNTDITLGNSVIFTDNSVLEATSWQWDFGDGNTSTDQNPTHTYNAEGTYTVILTASNGVLSATKTKSDYLTVTDVPSGTFTDSRDGTEYQTITIGNQEWMAENLKYLPSVVGLGTGSQTIPYYYVYGYNGTDVAAAKSSTNYSTYGVLYNWPAAMNSETSSTSNPSGVQGVCPDGWHLPSHAEWTELTDYLGGESVAGGKLKETGTTHWNSPNAGATNETGFTALPGSYRINSGTFSNIGNYGYWWSASELSTDIAWTRYMYYNGSYVGRSNLDKEFGFSVRCVRD